MGYISVTDDQRAEMLGVCGAASVDGLFDDIPGDLRPPTSYNNGFGATEGISEFEAVERCRGLAAKNETGLISFVGGGFYDHYIPAAIDAIISRSEFYTAYTPYQPELSQGTLQAIYEYQSQICRLTGMEISNASLYDGGTAIFEACKMALSSSSRKKIVVDDGVNPIYINMLRTHTANLGVDIVVTSIRGDDNISNIIDNNTAAAVLQNPNYFGIVDDHSDIVKACKEKGIVTIQSVNPISLALIKSPAEQGFDIAVGEGQSLGIPLSFGGPYLGIIAAKKELARKMPGRIVARTVDINNKPGFVLSLQAREQHIRREKATSNICSNEALCALRAHSYLSLLGTEGLKDVASQCHSKAVYLRDRIKSSIPSIKTNDAPIFNEFVIETPADAAMCHERMVYRGFIAGIPLRGDPNRLLLAVTEKRTKEEMDSFADNLAEAAAIG